MNEFSKVVVKKLKGRSLTQSINVFYIIYMVGRTSKQSFYNVLSFCILSYFLDEFIVMRDYTACEQN